MYESKYAHDSPWDKDECARCVYENDNWGDNIHCRQCTSKQYVAFGSEYGGTFYGIAKSIIGAKRIATKNKSTNCKLYIYKYNDTVSTGNECRYPLDNAKPVAYWNNIFNHWVEDR